MGGEIVVAPAHVLGLVEQTLRNWVVASFLKYSEAGAGLQRRLPLS
jgi:hypothetical protein